MDRAALVTIALVAAALLGIWLLPMRKRWNDDGAADAQRQAAEPDRPVTDPWPDEPETDRSP